MHLVITVLTEEIQALVLDEARKIYRLVDTDDCKWEVELYLQDGKVMARVEGKPIF